MRTHLSCVLTILTAFLQVLVGFLQGFDTLCSLARLCNMRIEKRALLISNIDREEEKIEEEEGGDLVLTPFIFHSALASCISRSLSMRCWISSLLSGLALTMSEIREAGIASSSPGVCVHARERERERDRESEREVRKEREREKRLSYTPV